ncbi:MAG: DUF262 domain-containing protein [Gemmatimonadota bacterium]|nr:DUF262 domain-containing protein [Gemmatimonadota bacterium]
MRKMVSPWTVEELSERFGTISFPAYQREPTVWSRAAKQRLIDSMLREFDIAAFYFYGDRDGESVECVDGRQRIGAIMSFLDQNEADRRDNGFQFQVMNELNSEDEIYGREGHPFETLSGMTYREIQELGESAAPDAATAREFLKTLLTYPMTVVLLSDSLADVEFNLQFTRLNLGTLINSGEKLHAMVGDLRDVCFDELAQHAFLRSVGIRTRRFAKAQLAAQIITQVFAIESASDGDVEDRLVRMRYGDLQYLFKKHARLADQARQWIEKLAEVLDGLNAAFEDPGVFRSQAMVLSVVVLAYDLWEQDEFDPAELATFVEIWLERLGQQVKKGLRYDGQYEYLLEFNLHVTQASVERKAVNSRAKMLKEEFAAWRKTGVLRGDDEVVRS